jgi:IrrE N-terminal-like domain
MELQADYLELEMPELAEHLLREAGQLTDAPTNPTALLDYLNLQFAMIDLAALLPGQKKQPRGVLSYSDRIVGVDVSLSTNARRARFTTMHEIGHYVLPNHQNDLYICDEQDLSFEAKIETEKEANTFAAELLFKGDRFTRQANDFEVAPESIKTLALRYDASFESTARRFVERNARACSLAVFAPAPSGSVIDTSRPGRWRHRYTISSPEFRTRYFSRFSGDVPTEVIKKLVVPGRDVSDSIDIEITVPAATEEHRLRVSFFTNHHCVFGLVQPATKESE